jgi:hypothetical protein
VTTIAIPALDSMNGVLDPASARGGTKPVEFWPVELAPVENDESPTDEDEDSPIKEDDSPVEEEQVRTVTDTGFRKSSSATPLKN